MKNRSLLGRDRRETWGGGRIAEGGRGRGRGDEATRAEGRREAGRMRWESGMFGKCK